MADKSPDAYPKLDILSCPAAVSKKLAVLVGTLEDLPEREPRLFVNEKEIPVKSGKWLVSVPLSDGVNRITITAANNTGKNSLAYKEILCGALPPRFELDAAPALTGKASVTLNGSVVAVSGGLGLPEVYCGEKSVEVNADGRWSCEAELKPGENNIRLTAKSGFAPEAVIELIVMRESEAPDLVFTSFLKASRSPAVDINGRLKFDAYYSYERKCELFAGDRAVLIGPDGGFTARLRLKQNNPPVVFTVKCGGEYSITQRVDYDPAPPVIELEKCEPGAKAGTYKVAGRVYDEFVGIASTIFGGKELHPIDGAWTAFVPVKPGFNRFEAEAINTAAKSCRIHGCIFVEPAAPVLAFTDCPATVNAATVTVSGTVADPDADATPNIFVNDYPAKVINGAWKMELDILQGKNPVTVLAKSATGKTARLEGSVECTLAVPVLKVLNCPKTTKGDKITVMGFARGEFANTGKPVAVYVNAEKAEISDGKWSFEATLTPGENKLVFAAVNDDGVRTEDVKTVVRE